MLWAFLLSLRHEKKNKSHTKHMQTVEAINEAIKSGSETGTIDTNLAYSKIKETK